VSRVRLFSDTVRLGGAVSIVFAVATLLPFLVLLSVLVRLDVLHALEAQVGLLVALAVAALGFVLLRRMVSPIARLAEAVQSPAGAAALAGPRGRRVAGLGQVAEIGELGDAVARMLGDLRASTSRLEDLVFKLGALNEVVELAARVPKIHDLLALVLERTMRTVRARTGSILLLDPERRVLRMAAARGLPPGIGADHEIPLGEGIAGRVAQTGEALVVNDVEADPRIAGSPDLRHGAGSFICLPVRVDERVIGVINLARTDRPGAGEPRFTPTDVQFLNTLMTHIAYSLDNARLLAQSEQAAARLGEVVEDLKAAQARLVEGETLRAMGQMSSGMAHHLNNLLAVVSGRVQLLALRVTDPALRRQFDIVRRATDDAAEVVRRVLEFTAVRPVAETASLDLNHLVRQVLELTRPRWHDDAQLRGVAIRVALQLGDVPAAAGEAAAVREVLTNLVLNAVDALPEGGGITIRTWVTGRDVHCAVSDTGVGMSDEVRRRALEPFFTTKGPGGVGLGLSVAHGILQRHRGDLQIESTAGQGTTVTFRLPSAAPPAASETPQPPAITPRRILLIEDEAAVRDALADALSAHGHTIVPCDGGRDGLARLEAGERVDLVLSDLGMPDLTGWDVARVVRERWPGVPVALITGWGPKPEATPAQLECVEFVLAKPFAVETLLLAIEKVPRPA
jgi:signal transduction histidine kinase